MATEKKKSETGKGSLMERLFGSFGCGCIGVCLFILSLLILAMSFLIATYFRAPAKETIASGRNVAATVSQAFEAVVEQIQGDSEKIGDGVRQGVDRLKDDFEDVSTPLDEDVDARSAGVREPPAEVEMIEEDDEIILVPVGDGDR